MLSVVMLGSGTSTGIPVVGCACSVCRSEHPKNRRSRPSLWLRWDQEGVERSVVIDTGPDFRYQSLREGMSRLDAILFTHAHADHIMGLDDVRPFNFRQRTSIPCFGSAATLEQLRRIYAYAFEEQTEGGGVPRLELCEIEGAFELFGESLIPVPVLHGTRRVLGFRLRDFAYVTDVSAIPEASFEILKGVRVMILGALRYRPHSTHFTLAEAVEALAAIGPERAYFTHLSCEVDHEAVEIDLPVGVELGYDGLRFELP
ncbi:MAG: MBL fold metallo-hydrolase [Acidobacteriota bacterium]